MTRSYRQSGVDIAAADALVDIFKRLSRPTWTADCLPGQAYAGLYRLPHATLAATCDGVGTKLLVALMANKFYGLGQDLVAMNVNDLICVGARPLFFLDYLSTADLDEARLTELFRGMTDALTRVGCALLGGETAQMPGLYDKGALDLAGFAVGIVETPPTGERLVKGDVLWALPSSGVHANGMSLARRVLLARLDGRAPDPAILEMLLLPTELYVEPGLAALKAQAIKHLLHITGGGLFGRLARVLRQQPDCDIHLERQALLTPPIFELIQRQGDLSDHEMFRTFNMGAGMVAIGARDLNLPQPWFPLGTVVSGSGSICL